MGPGQRDDAEERDETLLPPSPFQNSILPDWPSLQSGRQLTYVLSFKGRTFVPL
jgi:hypothetical protein